MWFKACKKNDEKEQKKLKCLAFMKNVDYPEILVVS